MALSSHRGRRHVLMAASCNVHLPSWDDFPDAGARLDEIRHSLEAARGQVSGALQGKLDDLRATFDELRGSLPEELPTEIPPEVSAKVNELHQRLAELRGQVSGAAQGKVDEVRHLVEELRAGGAPGHGGSAPAQPGGAPAQPAHPIEGGDPYDQLAAIKAKLIDLHEQVTAAAQPKLEEVRHKFEEIRAQLPEEYPIDVSEFVARLQDARLQFEDFVAQLPDTAAAAAEEVRHHLEALHARACEGGVMMHMPSLVEQVQGTFDLIREHIPEQAQNALDQAATKLEEVHGQVVSGVGEIVTRLDEAIQRLPKGRYRRRISRARNRLEHFRGAAAEHERGGRRGGEAGGSGAHH